MRGKSIVGWLCVFSLLSALALGFYALYVSCVPFMNGGAVYYFYNEQWPDGLAKEIAKDGLNSSDAGKLASFAWRTQQDMNSHRGWGAGIWMLQEQFQVVTRPPATAVPALIITDTKSNVVAAYPPDLENGLRHYVPGDRDSEAMLRDMTEMDATPEYLPLNSGSGERLGTLVVLRSGGHAVAYVPYAFRHWNFGAARVAIAVALIQICLGLLILPVWVGLDAAYRGMRPFAWGFLVAVTSVIGLLAYLIARLSPPKPCPNCGEPVLAKYRRCPRCGLSLPSRCPICRTKLRPGWQYCPKCAGVPAPADEATAPAPPPPPARTSPPPVDEPSLTVSVFDAGSGNPIADARIALKGPSVMDGVTSSEGVFHARRIVAGGYTVAVTKPGYNPSGAEASAAAGPPRELRLALEAMPASVAGCITDQDGLHSLAGARVYLDTTRIDKSTTTDEAGCYSLGDIPPGPYVICVEAEGCESQTRLVELPPGREANVSFTLNSAPAPVGGQQE